MTSSQRATSSRIYIQPASYQPYQPPSYQPASYQPYQPPSYQQPKSDRRISVLHQIRDNELILDSLFSVCPDAMASGRLDRLRGSNVEEIVVNNTHFLMWDIGGQESLRSSWNTYYTNTEE
ncbi:hypothetical protein CRUP_027490 [Coryphaenoides rupestris]|nr:hypothetical protein CRUP_027490 [Coryphaenoides rupestris]